MGDALLQISRSPGSSPSLLPYVPRVKQRRSMRRLLACTSYAISSVLLSLTNKAVFSDQTFDFPLSVLACQALGTVVLLKLGSALQITSRVSLQLPLLRMMIPITLIFAAMLGSSSRALRLNSVPVVTIFKNLSVVVVCIYEHAIYRQAIPAPVLASLVIMLGGSVVAGIADMHFSLVAMQWLLLNVALTVCHIVAIRSWLTTCNASSSEKSFHNQLVALFVFLLCAIARGEIADFATQLCAQSILFKIGFGLSIVLGLLINVASFWCLSVTSGTTYSFVGASNKVPTTILGHILFGSGLTTLGWVGVLCGLGAGLCYAVSKPVLDDAKRSPARPSASGSSLSLREDDSGASEGSDVRIPILEANRSEQ